MYVFEHITSGNSCQCILWEMTAKELFTARRKAVFEDAGLGDPTHTYERASGSEAHEHVRRGGTHNTGLYMDGNRIRYAKGE